MLTAFLRAFRTPDLRRKLLFTICMIAVFRLGAALPTPGISESAVHQCIGLASTQGSSVFALVNLFSGGALLKLSVFALGIMPYITASIILQLLAVVIPRLETLRQEGVRIGAEAECAAVYPEQLSWFRRLGGPAGHVESSPSEHGTHDGEGRRIE